MRSLLFPRRKAVRRPAFVRLEALEAREVPALFTPGSTLTPSSSNNNGCVATGDFDKDGNLDAVVSNYGSSSSDFASSVTVLFGNGAGAFSNQVEYSTGANQHINFVAVGDLDGDGFEDIVATSSNADNSGSFIVLHNTGIGTFQVLAEQSSGGNRAVWGGIGDFDSDGIPDIAICNLGSGTGNNEGNNIAFFKGVDGGNGKGNSTFTVSNIIESGFELVTSSATIVDVDGKNGLDLVATVITADPESTIEQTNGKLAIVTNDGSGTMTLGSTYPGTNAALPISINHADINNDGKQDLLVANVGDPDVNGFYMNFGAGSGFTYLLGDGFGGFGNASKMTTGIKSAWTVAPGDYNLDGKVDVAIANYGTPFGTAGSVVVYLGNGAGAFTVDANSPYTDSSQGMQYLASADFDKKGNRDIVTVGDHNRVHVLNNTTRPTTTNLTASATDLQPGQNVTFTATVTINAPYTEQPAGTVTFFDGNSKIGTGTLALDGGSMKATFSTTTLANGSHDITASYGGASSGSYATGISKSSITNVTVSSAPNTPPTISDVTNQTVLAGATVGPISFTINDAETPASSLTLSAKSSNGGVIPAGNVVFGGSDSNRTVSVTAPSGASGSSTITITVTDAGGQSASDTFDVTVGSNTAPGISDIADVKVTAGSTVGPINFLIGDNESAPAALTLKASSNNPALIPNGSITFGGTGSVRNISFPTIAGFAGNTTITVTVTDEGGLTASDSFVVAQTLGASINTITSTSGNGTYTTGQTINVSVNFSESVTLSGGNLNITLDSGGSVAVGPFTGTTASGTYTVLAGQTSADLNVTGLALGGGANLVTTAGSAPVSLSLPSSNLANNANLIVNPPPPTTVTFIDVNNGEAQRSRITSLTLNFNNPVNAADFTAQGAITLTRTAATKQGTVGTVVQTGAAPGNGLITLTPSSGTITIITLSFSNAGGASTSAGVENGSLSDGRWQLAIPSIGYISSLNDPNLRRLFGDANASGTVDGDDFALFGNVFNAGSEAFDFDITGNVDSIDFAQFGNRYGVTL